jgi:hypothetical protein
LATLALIIHHNALSWLIYPVPSVASHFDLSNRFRFSSTKCLTPSIQSLRDRQWTMNLPYWAFQHDVLRHCLLPFFWGNLNGLQLFLRFEVSQKRPDAKACWSHKLNASSSSSTIISASKSHGNLLELQRWLFSKPTMFTWKLGRWVLGLQAIPCMQ